MEIITHRHQISAEQDWYQSYAISLGIRVGNLGFVSSQAAVDAHGDTVGGADFSRRPDRPLPTRLGAAQLTNIAVIGQGIELRREVFTPPNPADTIAQVESLARPE